jgi:Transglutaminase-like superfamily
MELGSDPTPARQPDLRPAARPLSVAGRLRLLWPVWTTAVMVWIQLRRGSLPDMVERLGPADGRRRTPPTLLSRAVSRGLRLGPWQPRCLVRALVLYRLLRAQGDRPILVIGLHEERPTAEAHAWVELGGRDIGPAPGAFGHRPLARYPLDAGDGDAAD